MKLLSASDALIFTTRHAKEPQAQQVGQAQKRQHRDDPLPAADGYTAIYLWTAGGPDTASPGGIGRVKLEAKRPCDAG